MSPIEAFFAGLNSLPWWLELPAVLLLILAICLMIDWRRP